MQIGDQIKELKLEQSSHKEIVKKHSTTIFKDNNKTHKQGLQAEKHDEETY